MQIGRSVPSFGCPYSPEQEHHYNVRGTCVWCGEYETRRITVPQAHLPLGLCIDRHQGRCKGRVVVSEEGGRCMGCGKRFTLGVIVKYTERRDGSEADLGDGGDGGEGEGAVRTAPDDRRGAETGT